jgi:hypothetical protein
LKDSILGGLDPKMVEDEVAAIWASGDISFAEIKVEKNEEEEWDHGVLIHGRLKWY